jgi:penicillin amidase
VAWLKAMAWDLRSNIEEELSRARLARTLSREQVEQLFPAYPFDEHPTIVAGEPRGPDVAPVPDAARALPRVAGRALDRVRSAIDAGPELLGPPGSGIGSNSWVVSGAHTASGMPLLANDPHLGPSLPSIWSQMGLHCTEVTAACPFDVSGFTFSGLPGVVIGHNADIAWGFTNLAPDVGDLVLEKVRGDTYEYAGEQLDLEVREELIGVAGGEPRRLRVRSTRHGPLVSDVSNRFRRAGDGEYAVALRWTALTPGRSMDALFALNRAGDWEEMRTAVSLFEVPAQNVVYADRTGRIGYQAPGKVPVRIGYDGRWPAEGWTGEQEWTGFVDYDRMPRVVDPPEGFLVAANQAVVPPSYPVFLTDDWDAGYRAARIADRLQRLVDQGDVTTDRMLRLQRDQRSAIASPLLPYLLDVSPSENVDAAVEQLRRWDLRQDAGSAGAAYFNAVWRHVLRLTFHDQLPKAERPDGGGRWMQVVTGLLDDPRSPWWDDVRTERRETRDGLLTEALVQAHDELADRLGGDPDSWRWGELHALPLESPTFGQSGIGPVEWLVNHGDVDVGGGESTVVATGWSSDEGYQTDWVPSMRMVVDLAELDASRWVNLTGASGHAFHDNYTDQVELWRDGRTTAWPFSQAAVEEAARHTLVLRP